jgi:hypothetical protein
MRGEILKSLLLFFLIIFNLERKEIKIWLQLLYMILKDGIKREKMQISIFLKDTSA